MHVKGLIVGLGNPGRDYLFTRHNFGFMAVDWLIDRAAERKGMHLHPLEASDLFHLWTFFPAGHLGGAWLLLKPMTGMNDSGRAVAKVRGQHNILPQDVFVIHDEMGLDLGRMRFVKGMPADHHKGVQSVADHLGTDGYYQMRLGIGRPPEGVVLRDWVIEPFNENEIFVAWAVLDAVWRGIELYHRCGEAHAEHYLHQFRGDAL